MSRPFLNPSVLYARLGLIAFCLLFAPRFAFSQITLAKSVNAASASPGNPVTYTLAYSNAVANAACQDNFESGTLGSFPSGWVSSGGNWTLVSDNGPSGAGSQALQGVAATGNYPYLHNLCSGQTGDGYVQADMKIGPGGGQAGVLLFRFNGTTTVNGSNYQTIIGVGNTNNVQLAYWDNGTSTFHNVGTGSAAIAANAWNTIKFEVTGTGPVTLKLYVNGTQVLSVTTAFVIPTGQAGLQSNDGSTVRFDNVSIVEYPPAYGVSVTDNLPAGLAYTSASGSPTVAGQKVVWNLGNLASGASGTLTLTGTVSNCGISLVNQAQVDSTTPLKTVFSNPVTTILTACSPTPTLTFTSTYSNTPTNTPTKTFTLTQTPTSTNSNTPVNTSTETYTVTDTPTDTSTFTPTDTPTDTSTNTPTDTSTDTPSDTPTDTLTPTSTFSDTPVDTSTETYTVTDTPTDTPTDTSTFTPTDTPTDTPTETWTPTSTFSNTPMDTSTETSTETYTITDTPTDSPTDTSTFTPTETLTDTPTDTPTETWTPTSTFSNTPMDTLTDTYTFTDTPSDTPTNSFSPTPTFTFTDTPVDTSTDTPTDTSTFTPTDTPTDTTTNTPNDTSTYTPTDTPTNISTFAPTDTPTNTPTNSLSPTPAFTVTYTPVDTSTETYTFTNTPTDSMTATPYLTATPTVSPTASATNTPTNSFSPTSTFTPAVTFTPTATQSQNPPPTSTPTYSISTGCGGETLTIFDQRGELVRSLCGLIPPLALQAITFTVSPFVPSVDGLGGSLSLLVNGQTAAVWDAKDGTGKIVPNGFYQLVLFQKFRDGTNSRMEKEVYISPQGPTAPIQFAARPNLAQSGDVIILSAMFGQIPADGRSFAKIYTIGGERVKTLAFQSGQATWNLTNSQGEIVSSGLYLIVLDGVDAATGAPARKTIKVVVLK